MPKDAAHPLRRALLPGLLWLALASPAPAAPALEYGPEAEAGFIARCAGETAPAAVASSCQRMMERLQASLGYEAFLERAAGGPDAFGPAIGRSLAVAAPPR